MDAFDMKLFTPIEVKDKHGTLKRYMGILHNDKKPAVVKKNGDEIWYMNGKIHREGYPAMHQHEKKSTYWYRDGLFHRENGPAIELCSGYKAYYQNGKLHRTDGPAIIDSNNIVEFWEEGKRVSKD